MSILESKLFSGQQAFVTGAASNIGRSIATHLAAEGANLTITDIDPARLASVEEEIAKIGNKPRSFVCDLSNTSGWREAWEVVKDAPPEIFVHSACPQRHERDSALKVSEETFDAMMNTNLRSGFLLGREIAEAMSDEKIAGRLLYITSLHANEPRNLPHYSASKAGVAMIVKELARAMGPAGIRVNGIAPGSIPGGGAVTPNHASRPGKKIPMGRFGHADDIARAAMALLSNDFMGYVTGTTLTVDGGLQLFNWIDLPEA